MKLSNMKWWTADKDDCHAAIIQTIGYIRNEQSYRRAENIRNARLYGNVDVLGLSSFTYTRSASGNLDNRVTMNVIQSCVDTSEAKIASRHPKPMFLTEAGDFDAQMRAKKLNKFVQGVFYDMGVYEKTPLCFKDGGVFGSGMYKVFSCNGKIVGERVFPDEIVVDDVDGFYGTPQSLYQTKAIYRSELIAMYPHMESKINELPAMKSEDGLLVSEHADQVLVAEAWHLPVVGHKKNKKEILVPGKHAIVIDGATLLHEDWMRDHYPFSKFDYNPKLYGYWAQGLAEILMGKQIEINKLLRNIQLSHYFCATPIWMKEKGSRVIDSHLNNQIGNILTYSGVKPTLEVFQTVSPEIYNHLNWLIQSSFEEAGISQLSAASRNPLGANASGKALATFNDFETERFARVGQRWEAFHMDIAKLVVEEAKALYKNEKVNLTVKAENGDYVETIKFSDIDLDESKYVMKLFPISSFSSTPAAKLDEVTKAMEAGLIDPETGMDLLEFPDLNARMSLRMAKRKLIERVYDTMVDTAEFMPAEPFMDLNYALEYGQNYYNLCKLNKVPDDRLELIRRFMSQAEMILSAAQPQEAPMAFPEEEMPMDEFAEPEMIAEEELMI